MESNQEFVLLRHGQSQWNLENRFTGWTDVALTERGRQEAIQAARRLGESGFRFDVAFTSMLQRAGETLEIVLQELDQGSIPSQSAWELNERHYGCLQGLNKAETARRLGAALVMAWRRSYCYRPPALELDDLRHPRFESLYASIPETELPRTESLEDTEKRLRPYWNSTISRDISSGRRVLVVAHGNSLRALVRYLEQIPPDLVPGLDIPTGIPLICQGGIGGSKFERYELK